MAQNTTWKVEAFEAFTTPPGGVPRQSERMADFFIENVADLYAAEKEARRLLQARGLKIWAINKKAGVEQTLTVTVETPPPAVKTGRAAPRAALRRL